jgi:hypothetical protein
MDSDRLNDLLSRYWNCETTLEEEQQLREYFRGNEIPPQLTETAALFRYFDAHKKKSLPDPAFDAGVLQKINAPKKGKMLKLFYNSMRIAAGVAVLVMAIYLVRNEIRTSNPNAVTDESDPKLALEETKKALLMISKSFGNAEEKAKKINMFNEAKEKLQKKETVEL